MTTTDPQPYPAIESTPLGVGVMRLPGAQKATIVRPTACGCPHPCCEGEDESHVRSTN